MYPEALQTLFIRIYLVKYRSGGNVLTRRIFLSPRFFLSAALLATIVVLVTILTGLSFKETWPLFLGAFGFAGFYSGIRGLKRLSANFTIPSIAFLVLSFFFSLFSFGVMTIRFKSFVLRYWPWVFIAAGILYAVIWYFFRYRVDHGVVQRNVKAYKRPEHGRKRGGGRS
jgi:hypothetical protein